MIIDLTDDGLKHKIQQAKISATDIGGRSYRIPVALIEQLLGYVLTHDDGQTVTLNDNCFVTITNEPETKS